jgi:2-keto-4-pentenoate hydratase
MNDAELQALCEQLLDARSRQVPLRTAEWPRPSIEDAYAIQDRCARAAGWFPTGRPCAWKVGAPSRDATPTAAPLPDAGLLESGAAIPTTRLPRAGIEAELAVTLARDVPDAASIADGRPALEALIDRICVSIEIVDSRFAEAMSAPPACRLADLQLHSALVTGASVPFAPRDWAAQRCAVTLNGRPFADVRGSHPCGDPLWSLRWLLSHAAARCGGLRRGDLVTTGAWTGIVPVRPGDEVAVRFEGVGEALVRFAR